MNAVKDVYLTTAKLIGLLVNTEHPRDEKINEISSLLELREQQMKQISPPFSDGEKVLGKQIVALNEKLNQLLKQEKGQIEKELTEVRLKKKSEKKYVNPYSSLQATDGVFYDKRK